MKYIASTFLLFLLASCGGGGPGSSQTISTFGFFSYPSSSITVFEQKTIIPNTSGFENHPPQCTLMTGSVPTGMQMSQDCNIVGVPTSVGTYSFSFKLTRSGSNTETKGNASITVIVPSLKYQYASRISTPVNPVVNLLTTSEIVFDAPVLNVSSPWPQSSISPVVWKYQMTSGSLPPGLKMDATTGVISGQPTKEGSYWGIVQATVSSSFGDLVLTSVPYSIDVTRLKLTYSYSSGLFVGWPFKDVPVITPTMTNSVANFFTDFAWTVKSTIYTFGSDKIPTATTTPGVPVGLTLNPVTGEISGTPFAPTKIYTFYHRNDYSIEFTVTAKAHQNNAAAPIPVSARFSLFLQLPFYYYYGTSVENYIFSGTVNNPLPILPIIKEPTTTDGFIPTRQFSTINSPTCTWDFGLVLDAITGNITGTPKKIGKFDCEVMANVNFNGTSWKQSIPITFDIK